MTGIINQYGQQYIDWITTFFSWYNVIGRQILDFFNAAFENIFNVLLAITVVISTIYFAMSLYILFKKKEQKKEDSYKGELPSVTVQIPTFNELAAIRCARSCLKFDYPKDKYEIIIGDDSNDPKVSGKIVEFAKGHSSMVRVFNPWRVSA